LCSGGVGLNFVLTPFPPTGVGDKAAGRLIDVQPAGPPETFADPHALRCSSNGAPDRLLRPGPGMAFAISAAVLLCRRALGARTRRASRPRRRTEPAHARSRGVDSVAGPRANEAPPAHRLFAPSDLRFCAGLIYNFKIEPFDARLRRELDLKPVLVDLRHPSLLSVTRRLYLNDRRLQPWLIEEDSEEILTR
jgi:hypothetical protein